MVETSLLPCPFCGGNLKTTRYEDDYGYRSWIFDCPKGCGVMINPKDSINLTKREAIAAVNRRAGEADLTAEHYTIVKKLHQREDAARALLETVPSTVIDAEWRGWIARKNAFLAGKEGK